MTIERTHSTQESIRRESRVDPNSLPRHGDRAVAIGPGSPSDVGVSLPVVWTAAEWVAYFRANAARWLDVPWELGAEVSRAELVWIVGSLRSWQLGETSDGRHLLAMAEKYAIQVGDPDFLEAIRLFVTEEQRHGRLLGQFLDLAGVPRLTRDWGDVIFRLFRSVIPRLEICASVVVMVETLALLYYAAIRRGTQSAVLRLICRQILADEVPHIRFQCERLAILHCRRSPVLLWVTMAVHRFVFAGIALAVWFGHRQGFRVGGYTFRRFWRTSWAKMGHAWRMMAPGKYRWTGGD